MEGTALRRFQAAERFNHNTLRRSYSFCTTLKRKTFALPEDWYEILRHS